MLAVPVFEPGAPPQTLDGSDLPGPADGGNDDDAVFASVELPDGEPLRVRVSRQGDGEVLVIGKPLDTIEHTGRLLMWILVGSTVAALVAVGLIGTWLVKIGLRPLAAVETPHPISAMPSLTVGSQSERQEPRSADWRRRSTGHVWGTKAVPLTSST
jgi:hypothetical protein